MKNVKSENKPKKTPIDEKKVLAPQGFHTKYKKIVQKNIKNGTEKNKYSAEKILNIAQKIKNYCAERY